MASMQCLAARQAPAARSFSAGTARTGSRRPVLPLAARSSSVDDPRSGSSGPSPALARRQLLGAAAAAALVLSLPRPAAAAEGVPKAYQDLAVKLVAALREAISTDLSDAEERQVRRAADPAKNLVREFLGRWKDNPAVAGEESYAQLTSAIQQLGTFYQRNGQRARLSSEVGQAVLDALDAAEAALPAQQEVRGLLPFL